jgi:serine/threonine protein kinase
MRARDYQPGEQVPGTVYKVLRLIGAGGMGTVYDVEDTTIGKRYVLKTLHPRLGAREDLVRRIQHEARTLARLHHPNIVEVITAGVTSDDLRLPYYLMERLSGQSLRLILEKKGQLELAHAYHIGIDLLDALDHAHDKGVIHRDVKPDNIFLHRTMAGATVTKLLDFGIVSMLDGGTRETGGRFLGTLRYAAPEQLRGEKPTPKTDVYSAALVIYEIVAGRGPFDDQGDASRIAAAHMNQPAPPVSQFVTVPRGLDVLLMAALAKEPEARPRDAFSFASSLRNLNRQHEEERPRVSADLRVTAAAVLSPESAPSIVSGASSPRNGLLSGVSSSSGSRGVPVPRTASIRTTLAGMPGSAVTPSPTTVSSALETTHNASARVATTGSIVATDTLPMPQNGTEALAPPPQQTPLGELDTEIQWPPQRLPMPSDEPQVRSLPVPTLHRRPLWPIVVASAALAIAAVLAMRVAPFRSSPAALTTVGAKAIVVVSAATQMPSSTQTDAIPAPMLAVPAFRDVPAAPNPGMAQGAPVPLPSARSGAKAPLVTPAVPAPAHRSGALMPSKERPGPGF